MTTLSVMEYVFHPRSVAVIGASAEANKHGNKIIRNLKEFGYNDGS